VAGRSRPSTTPTPGAKPRDRLGVLRRARQPVPGAVPAQRAGPSSRSQGHFARRRNHRAASPGSGCAAPLKRWYLRGQVLAGILAGSGSGEQPTAAHLSEGSSGGVTHPCDAVQMPAAPCRAPDEDRPWSAGHAVQRVAAVPRGDLADRVTAEDGSALRRGPCGGPSRM